MLTHTQRKLLLFIEKRLDETGGVSPCMREMAIGVGLSPTGKGNIHKMLTNLEERGFISRRRNRHQAITVLRPVTRYAVFRFDDEKKELVNA